MMILLDIDGVLVTTAAWRPVEILADGFMKFNGKAAANLQKLILETGATIVLTTTHRINYSTDTWKDIFKLRGISANTISKINDRNSIPVMLDRATEIKEWFHNGGNKQHFVVIDDDPSLNGLPTILKNKCVITKPLIGLDEEATTSALRILRVN